MACTTLLVGKKASFDGSTLVARTEDSGAGAFNPKKFIIVTPDKQPRKYKSVISGVEIDLPDNPMRYSAMPNATNHEGIWACAGVNDKNIAMTATETITTNERVLAADPLVIGGIGEEDIVTLVLPYINSPREGVERLGYLLEKYGTYEMNGIGFHDENEIWWLETIGGHHWIAKKVPDNCYVVMPNQLGIDSFDLEDAKSEKINHMASADLEDFIKNNYLDLSLHGKLNPRDAFGSHSDSDHTYNTPRAWIIQRYFNPNSNVWDGDKADYKTFSDDIPWARTPEKKITIEDVKYVLSHHYQGTPYDPYSNHADPLLKGSYRPIGINRNNVLVLTQIRPYMPENIKAVEWIAYGSTTFNGIVPFYPRVNVTPQYLANTTNQVSTDNFYWANRLIAALADYKYNENIAFIDRYKQQVQASTKALLNKYDREISANIDVDDSSTLEEANLAIANLTRSLTDDLLSVVLNQTILLMKNSFSRSDG